MAQRLAPCFPAAVRVSRALQQRIAAGHYGSESWLPTERDLAAEFGVSRPVVRAALSELAALGLVTRRPGCRPRVTRNGVQPAGSHANDGLPQSALHAIAAVLPQHPTYVSAHAILRGIASAIHAAGAPHRMSVFDTHPAGAPGARAEDSLALEFAALERIASEGVSGVILWSIGGNEATPGLDRLRDAGIPVVFIDRCPDDIVCDYVGVDNRAGMRAAVEHLLDLGHRRIAYLTIPDRVTTVLAREAGYRDALRALGLVPQPDLVFCTPAAMGADLSAAVDHFLSLGDRPTAVAALNDLHAFAFIREARARGWRVPEDISVIGFDDIESYSPHPSILTTVHQPFHELGASAAKVLLSRLEAPADRASRPYQHILLPASLVVRSTCRPARAGAPA